MQIDIEKLELSDVLVALVNAGATNTMTIQGNLPQLSNRIARELIKEGIEHENLHFDSVLGRTLQIDLNDDVIDVTAYDRANGNGTALKALQAIGEVKVVASVEIRNAMLHSKGLMEDRLADRPDMLMGEAAIRRRVTEEQYIELLASRHKPTQADMDAWMVRYNNASPEERHAMIHDNSIKYAYPVRLEDYQLKRPDMALLEQGKLSAPEHKAYHPLGNESGDILNSAIFKDSGEVHAALRMVGDSLVCVDLVAQSALLTADSPMPTFEAEHMSNKVKLLKKRVDELSDTGKETYYVKQLGRLDALPTVDTSKK